MKPDLNQLRDILIAVSNELVPDEYGFVSPVFPKELVKSSLSQYPENETLYWIRKMMDEQILIKGKKYITTPSKYYFTDIGLRNARLNFRQQEEDHLMENIIYNELLVRGYNVDVGVIEKFEKDSTGKTRRKQLEVDFVCNQASKRYYIQSAFAIPNKEKMEQEQKSLVNINDNFKKIIIVKDDINLWRNEQGILIISLEEFLLNPNSLDL